MTSQQERERDSLRAAVLAAPGDDAPRLIYADWLDEHGEVGADRLRLPGRLCRWRAGDGYAATWCVPDPKGGPELVAALGRVPCACGRRRAVWGPCGSLYLCDDCHRQWRVDPQAYLEFGPHPEGQDNWQQLQAEVAADAAGPAPPAGDEIPF